ncbi:MAG: hypothetical protein HN396_15010 [Gemmatimonadales bacterium]|jgi:hypothetical protein|nr:hypothetical protein [Gemmatimonadales bacterium]
MPANEPTVIYRPMRRAKDGKPELGASLATLGVRPDKDVPMDDDGYVEPLSGGMSVTPDRLEDVPPSLLPRKYGGEGRHTLFLLLVSMLPPQLRARIDKPRHANVEPTQRCLFVDYNGRVQGTRLDWVIHE